jgi:hypothetical protein
MSYQASRVSGSVTHCGRSEAALYVPRQMPTNDRDASMVVFTMAAQVAQGETLSKLGVHQKITLYP